MQTNQRSKSGLTVFGYEARFVRRLTSVVFSFCRIPSPINDTGFVADKRLTSIDSLIPLYFPCPEALHVIFQVSFNFRAQDNQSDDVRDCQCNHDHIDECNDRSKG